MLHSLDNYQVVCSFDSEHTLHAQDFVPVCAQEQRKPECKSFPIQGVGYFQIKALG